MDGIPDHSDDLRLNDIFQGEDISMLILLPNEMDGIHQLDAQVNTIDFASLSWNLESDDDVEVQLPRFKMEEKIDLKNVLEKVIVPN